MEKDKNSQYQKLRLLTEDLPLSRSTVDPDYKSNRWYKEQGTSAFLQGCKVGSSGGNQSALLVVRALPCPSVPFPHPSLTLTSVPASPTNYRLQIQE